MGWSKPTPYLHTVQIIKKQIKIKTMATAKKYSVDVAFIKAAHKEACGEWKTKIEKKFPEVFKPKKQVYSFRDGHKLDSASKPLLIGYGLAPGIGDRKYLIVSGNYKMEVKNHGGHQVLVFTEK